MTTYEKINSLFQRDERGRMDPGLGFSDPVFMDLWDTRWTATEKVDGTNIRLILTADGFEVRGRTDRAQIPPQLHAHCIGLAPAVRDAFAPEDGETVVIYGEGCGPGIQKGGERYGDSQRLIVFDVRIGRYWLERADVADVARRLGLLSVPHENGWTLETAHEAWLAAPQMSKLVHGPAEGWVLRPELGLLHRDGTPIRVKLKEKDYQPLRAVAS